MEPLLSARRVCLIRERWEAAPMLDKSRTPTLDDLRERMAALIRDLPRA